MMGRGGRSSLFRSHHSLRPRFPQNNESRVTGVEAASSHQAPNLGKPMEEQRDNCFQQFVTYFFGSYKKLILNPLLLFIFERLLQLISFFYVRGLGEICAE